MYTNPFETQSGSIILSKVREAGFIEKQFDTGTVKINYVVGPANGPALVLIPAQMGIWESYHKVLPALAQNFQVYATDVRGHGKSSWTPGDYSWRSIGTDMQAFLRQVVKRPAIISGNSSGGLIALWCAANVPQLTAGIILEDAPVFSAELPRFKEQDKFVFKGLERIVTALGDLQHRDLADYFRGQVLPISETRVKRFPEWMVRILSKQIAQYQSDHPGEPVELKRWYYPDTLRLLFKSISMFDPDFARAFVDGRFYDGLDHTAALSKITCPLLILHADWHRYSTYGLVGAMDDADAARIQELVPHAQYQKIAANHVIHMYRPKEFIQALNNFARSLSASSS